MSNRVSTGELLVCAGMAVAFIVVMLTITGCGSATAVTPVPVHRTGGLMLRPYSSAAAWPMFQPGGSL